MRIGRKNEDNVARTYDQSGSPFLRPLNFMGIYFNNYYPKKRQIFISLFYSCDFDSK